MQHELPVFSPGGKEEDAMPRYSNFEPKGVIPACILPFRDDLSIDERSYRDHLRHTAAVRGVSAITVNAHATEVASCNF